MNETMNAVVKCYQKFPVLETFVILKDSMDSL